MPRGYTVQSKKDREEIIELLSQGYTYGEIMDELGCSFSHVQKLALAYGFGHDQVDTAKYASIVADLIKTRLPIDALARCYKLSWKTIKNIYKELQERGVEMPARRRGRPTGKAKEQIDEREA